MIGHGSVKPDRLLEKELRVLYHDQQAIGSELKLEWFKHRKSQSLPPQ